MPPLPPVERLNELSSDGFADAVAPLFEGAPRFIRRLAARRPFGSFEALLDAARSVAAEMPEDEQVELLDAHPRIGAVDAAMSAMSRGEQAGGGPAPESIGTELAHLNDAYERRFGFRFVIFVAGRSRAQIAPILEAALTADRSAELRRGLDDIVAIAADRLAKARAAGSPSPTIGA